MFIQKENIIDRIDTLLNERDLKRQDLCNEVDITTAALSSLKKSNGVPSADTAIKIANFFHISVEWLITGSLSITDSFLTYPSKVYERIERLIIQKQVYLSGDKGNSNVYIPDFNEIYKLVGKVTVINWKNNRSIPSYTALKKIAEYFETSIEYIAEGKNFKTPNEVNKIEIDKSEYDDFKRFKSYKYFIYSYDCMYDPDKKYISQLVQRLFRLRRAVEGQDYDYDYIREHPLERERMLDPNISDEEYAEMRKEKEEQ